MLLFAIPWFGIGESGKILIVLVGMAVIDVLFDTVFRLVHCRIG